MHAGRKVRVRPDSPVARELGIPPDAQGTVICRYRILKDSQTAPDRLDVRFSPQLIVWGASEREFEVIAEQQCTQGEAP